MKIPHVKLYVTQKITPVTIDYRGKLLLKSGPEGIRTPSLLIRSQVLYPVELRDLFWTKFEGANITE